jgi:hypothetical protein
MGVEIAMPANQDRTTLKLDNCGGSWLKSTVLVSEGISMDDALLCSYGTNFGNRLNPIGCPFFSVRLS